jgi:hypothetical protein
MFLNLFLLSTSNILSHGNNHRWGQTYPLSYHQMTMNKTHSENIFDKEKKSEIFDMYKFHRII